MKSIICPKKDMLYMGKTAQQYNRNAEKRRKT